MSLKLSSNQKLFIERMTENQEQAKWGFEILLKTPDFENFFDPLQEAELFSPKYNSNPVEAEDPGTFHIPYWSALDYLEAVSRKAGENNDLTLARKVMNVIHSVSKYRDSDGKVRDNYHTYYKFAVCLGLMPTSAITEDSIDLLPNWIKSKYNRSLVVIALDEGLLPKLLESNLSEDLNKACNILNHCTAIQWVDETGFRKGRKKPVSIVDDYYLNKLIKNHAGSFGRKAGKSAAQIFRAKIQDVFGREYSDLPTYLHRPAVEDHPQNHSWDKIFNCFVDGLRDVLLSWIDTGSENAIDYIPNILEDHNEMVRRIGIYILGQRWSVLKNTYGKVLNSQLFDPRNVHELYHLLKERFGEFSEDYKSKTLETIRQLPLLNNEGLDHLKRRQRNWLSAIIDKGYEPVNSWFTELNADQSIGKLSEHPDFHSYIETVAGPGPSLYTQQDLLIFAEDGSIIERLNEFQQTDVWRGLSIEALVKSLEETVRIDPPKFLNLLPKFLNAKRPYQYGIINGFKRLWDSSKESEGFFLDWDTTWELLLDFFNQLLDNPKFWKEKVENHQGMTPNSEWISSIIAEFLRAGTRNDEKSYPPEFLSRGFELIKILLENSKAVDDAEGDAMTHAINSPKGKAIEALYSHTLRVCRISDSEHQDHSKEWNKIKPVFDTEINKCKDSNYEFSTLAAYYLPYFEYIDLEWRSNNIDKIFPSNYENNFICAIDGLTYTSITSSIYKLLLKHKIYERALEIKNRCHKTRYRIALQIALAYLWGDESLDSPRFTLLFDSGELDNLENISRFFWSAREQKLEEDQIGRIFQFWEKCIEWAKNLIEPPKLVLSELSRLTCYITNLGEKEFHLIKAVAKYVKFNYNADDFISELNRLVEQDPEKVSLLFGETLVEYRPDYDYEDRLKELLLQLDKKGRGKDALIYADKLRNIPGMNELYKKLLK